MTTPSKQNEMVIDANQESVHKSICQESMSSIWQRDPCAFQLDIITCVLKMRCKGNSHMACLLVHSTGGGKSAVYQAVGTIGAGATLVIETTLSLGADQCSKIDSATNRNGPVESFQLDSLKSKMSRQNLNQYLRSLDKDTNASIFLFSSPKELIKHPWPSLFSFLINQKILKLICVDEVHQHVSFCLAFRKKFCMLKKSLFLNTIDAKHA